MERLRVGSGTSEVADGRMAGAAAAGEALGALAGEPALLIVYASVRYRLEDVLAGVRQHSGEVPLVGASSAGHFVGARLTEPGLGVAVLALSAGPYRFGVASVVGLAADAFEAGRAVVRAARTAAGAQRLGHAAVMVFADGLVSDHPDLLKGIYQVTGAGVPVAGGAAADDRQLTGTFVFHDGKVLADAVVVVWIDAPHPLTVACAHGWQPCGMPLLVTRSEGTVVHELGGRSAVEVFQEHADGTPEGYYSARALQLIEPGGSELVRAAIVRDGTLSTFAPLPPFSAVQVVSACADELIQVGEDVATQIIDRCDPSVLLVFDCVARLDILAERGAEETARLQAAAGQVPVFGIYTYGEFARTNSVAGYHNASLAAIAL